MNAHVTNEQMARLMPANLSVARAPAVARQRKSGLTQKLAGIFQWLADLPRRRAVLDELRSLSDHELADIGLSRSDLSQIFDPKFVAERNTARFGRG
jgi:uncharacterized protein YjiS (DUF1127 family)